MEIEESEGCGPTNGKTGYLETYVERQKKIKPELKNNYIEKIFSGAFFAPEGVVLGFQNFACALKYQKY
jgi:hypothetical protein